jgi:hypothetical protein
MKDVGTAKAFDAILRHGQIRFEAAGDALRFETTAIAWDKQIPTVADRPLACDLVTNQDRPR